MKHIVDFFYSKCSLENKELLDNFEKHINNLTKTEDIFHNELKQYNLKWCFISKVFISHINNGLFDIIFKYNNQNKTPSIGFSFSKLFVNDAYLKLSFLKNKINGEFFYYNEIGSFINNHRSLFNIEYKINNLKYTIDINCLHQINHAGFNILNIKHHDYLIFLNDNDSSSPVAKTIFMNFLEPFELKNQLDIMYDLDVLKNPILNQIYQISLISKDII